MIDGSGSSRGFEHASYYTEKQNSNIDRLLAEIDSLVLYIKVQ